SESQDLAFGKWRTVHGRDGLGREGIWQVTTVKAVGAKPVQSLDFQVMLYNEAGVKMSGGLISFPDLKPGETGEVQVRIDKASRAVISNREKAQQSLKEQLTPLQASQGGMTIAAYLAQRPAGPTRITADCKLGNYYNYAYRRAAATYHSVSLSQS